jgi:preprotein translocase subunit SecF
LCYEAWAGWDSHDPCDTNEFQFLCQQRMVLNITTTEDTNCLSIIYPSEAVLRSYSENQQPPDACVSNVTSLGIAIVVAIVVAILGAFGVLCIYIYIRHRLNLAEYGEAEERSR